MQNKPNLLDALMNVTSYYTVDYENIANCKLCENKPNTNPIKPNFRKAKMNVSHVITKHYENKRLCRRRENKPNQTRSEAEIPTGELLGILKPGTKQTQHTLCEFFLFFTFLGASYNLAMQTWTIQKLLNWTTEYFTEKGLDSPRLCAELLLSHVVGLKRIELYTQFDKPIAKEQLDKLHDLVKRAGQHEPIAYLISKAEFYSLELNVTPDCMIPRPETELLVERAIEFLRTRPVRNSVMCKMTQERDISNGARAGKSPPLLRFCEEKRRGATSDSRQAICDKRFAICDLCTGSGCIAIAIARNYPDARIIATDISDAALNVATKNVEKHRLGDRIKLLCGDLFNPIMSQSDVDKFDLIVCNPPYVSGPEFEKLEKNIKDYQPKLALFAGDDGLDIYRRIAERVDAFLKPDAALMLEIGYSQAEPVRELLEQVNAFCEITIEKDFSDNDRVVIARKTSS